MPDLAAISFAALLVLILVVVLVQFMLWLRVKYEIKSDQATWKGVIEDVKRQAETATTASAAALSAANEANAKAISTATEATAGIEKARLKHEALAESLSHLNAKTVAREREASAAQARAAKRNSSAANATGEDDIDPDDEQQNILAAIAAQTSVNSGKAKKTRIFVK